MTHIDKDYELTRWSLSEVMQRSLRPSDDPVETKFTSRLVEKLKYCKEVLNSIRNAGSATAEPSSPIASGDE